jgi:hypothetical protein
VWQNYESSHGRQIQVLAEVKAVEQLREFLMGRGNKKRFNDAANPIQHQQPKSTNNTTTNYQHTLQPSDHILSLDAAMATFSLHIHIGSACQTSQDQMPVGHGDIKQRLQH